MILQEIINTSLLELIAGFGYLGGHFFLLSKKQVSGWIVKIIGGIAWIVFLLQNSNYIFGAVTIVIVMTMIYGFYKWKVDKFNKRTKIDAFFEILGTILLARKKLAGWYSYIAMSLLASVLVAFINPNPAIILGILEVLSIYFYYKGIRNFSKNTSLNRV